MSITIPTWVVWTLGILIGVPAGVAILVLAWFGYVALTSLGKGGFWR